LEEAITNTQAKAYQPSALGAAALQPNQDLGAQLLTLAPVLIGIVPLFAVLGGMAWRLLIRRRTKSVGTEVN
jgi:hypothetical protein